MDAETADLSSNTESVVKACRGNRFCSFAGPFHPEHLLVAGRGRPAFVGCCYTPGCGAFVCSRCAHSKLLDPGADGFLREVRVLCCPFDGEPLGDGDDWLLLTPEGEVLRRSQGPPALDAYLEEELGQVRLEALFEMRGHCSAIVGPAIERLHAGGDPVAVIAACDEALHLDPTYAVAWMLRRQACERAGDFAEAWRSLRGLLRLSRSHIETMLLELDLLRQPGDEGDSFPESMLLRYGEDFKEGFTQWALSRSPEERERSRQADLAFFRYEDDLRVLLDRWGRLPLSRAGTSSGLEGGPGEWARWSQVVGPIPAGPADDTDPLEAAFPDPNREPTAERTRILHLVEPRFGRVIAESWAERSQLTLLLFAHEQVFPEQQKGLYRLLEHFAGQAPEAPILLEGFAGPRPPGNPIQQRQPRMQRALDEIAAGKLAGPTLTRIYPPVADIRGADDAELLEGQRSALATLDAEFRGRLSAAGKEEGVRREPVLGALFRSCWNLQRALEGRALSPGLGRLLALTDELRLSLVMYALALRDEATALGLPLDGYPAVGLCARAGDLEKVIDLAAAERERASIVEEIVACSEKPLGPESARAVDAWFAGFRFDEASLLLASRPRRPEPPSSPPRRGFLRRLFRRRDPGGPESGPPAEPPFPSWLDDFLTLSLAVNQQIISEARFHERLRDLAAALRIDLGSRHHLRNYIAYTSLCEEIDAHRLAMEVVRLADELADRTASSALDRGLLELRRQLRELEQWMLLKLPAAKVRSVLASHPGAVEWITVLLRLGELVEPGFWEKETTLREDAKAVAAGAYTLDALWPRVRDYYFHACCRSAKLALNAAHDGLDRGPVAALVCSRFDLYEILRALRGEPEVSWLVVLPGSERAPGSPPTPGWGWLSPYEEVARVPPA